jgi:hypothetical protein
MASAKKVTDRDSVTGLSSAYSRHVTVDIEAVELPAEAERPTV